jgi:NitT/TauT family transport system ATP-binding protein
MSRNPGRIREEFPIPLPRPRDVNTPELAGLAQRITTALKRHASVEEPE